MKKLVLITCLLACISCIKQNTQNDWLLGKWKKSDDNTQKLTYEYWTKKNDSIFLGHGFILQNNDTIWQEKILLHKQASNWYLDISTPENKNTVRFKLISKQQNKLVFENKTHDFPKTISYWKANDKLYATVANETQKIEFQFELVKY